MHSFEVHSNESACRKVDVLGWTKSTTTFQYRRKFSGAQEIPTGGGLELTGSKEGTEENPKMSLLTAYHDKMIPATEAEHVRLS